MVSLKKGKPSESWGRKVNGLRGHKPCDSEIARQKQAQRSKSSFSSDVSRRSVTACLLMEEMCLPGKSCPVSWRNRILLV
jgi:hypothetical protein